MIQGFAQDLDSLSPDEWVNRLLDQPHHRSLNQDKQLGSQQMDIINKGMEKIRTIKTIFTHPQHHAAEKMVVDEHVTRHHSNIPDLFDRVSAHTMFLPRSEKRELMHLNARKGLNSFTPEYQSDLKSLVQLIFEKHLRNPKTVNGAGAGAGSGAGAGAGAGVDAATDAGANAEADETISSQKTITPTTTGVAFVAKLRFLVAAMNNNNNENNKKHGDVETLTQSFSFPPPTDLWKYYVEMQTEIAVDDAYQSYDRLLHNLDVLQQHIANIPLSTDALMNVNQYAITTREIENNIHVLLGDMLLSFVATTAVPSFQARLQSMFDLRSEYWAKKHIVCLKEFFSNITKVIRFSFVFFFYYLFFFFALLFSFLFDF